MIDIRLYRLAFAPALLAIVIAMFSLEGLPRPLDTSAPLAAFDGDRASIQARQIVSAAPERAPGGEGDTRTAELVAKRFAQIPAGAVGEQAFEAGYEGDDVTLRNVILTLPGDSASTVVVLAARDSAAGAGAATSAAATGVLIELASALGVSQHEKTFVLASTSGSAAGAAGASELLEALPQAGSIEAVIVISQPGAAEPTPPFVITSSIDQTSGPLQLARTAEEAVASQAGQPPSRASAFTQLARLAIPSGIGAQAPLIASGAGAITISSAGERALEGDQEASTASLDAFGRALLSTVSAVDLSGTALDQGPGTRLELGDTLIPGWTLALLALALILPAAVAAVDACARSLRERLGLGAGLAWAAARSLPLLGALAALYALALVSAIPRPAFPFDPGLYELSTRAAITLAAVALAGLASALVLRSYGIVGAPAPDGAVAALGALAASASLAVWLANPYLALLLVPLAHVWILAARRRGPAATALVGLAAALACLPAIGALVAVADALSLGAGGSWTYALMIADGQVGLAVLVPACLLLGAASGAIAIVARRPRGSRPGSGVPPPGGHRGEHPAARTYVELDASPISDRGGRVDLGRERAARQRSSREHQTTTSWAEWESR